MGNANRARQLTRSWADHESNDDRGGRRDRPDSAAEADARNRAAGSGVRRSRSMPWYAAGCSRRTGAGVATRRTSTIASTHWPTEPTSHPSTGPPSTSSSPASDSSRSTRRSAPGRLRTATPGTGSRSSGARAAPRSRCRTASRRGSGCTWSIRRATKCVRGPMRCHVGGWFGPEGICDDRPTGRRSMAGGRRPPGPWRLGAVEGDRCDQPSRGQGLRRGALSRCRALGRAACGCPLHRAAHRPDGDRSGPASGSAVDRRQSARRPARRCPSGVGRRPAERCVLGAHRGARPRAP